MQGRKRYSGRALSRRSFLWTALGAAGGLAAWSRAQDAASASPAIKLGVCKAWNEHEALRTLRFDYVEDSVRRLLVPDKPDDVFAKNREEARACSMPIRSCNGFFPGEMKLVGPEAAHDAAVAWADTAARRAAALGISFLVLGSGASRKVPDGFDRGKAEEQFVAVCRRIGEAAHAHGVIVAVEQLNAGECNFLTKLAEVVAVVDAVAHPGLQAVADFYHMARESEGPEAVAKAGARIRHCHIAERENRTAPGTKGDDFRPYFKALKAAGYAGGISIEGRWENFAEQAPRAISVLREQWATA
jgi:sugar phosphate isomerase/epimerase